MKYNIKISVFFIFTLVCNTFGEPQCSPYHYQEQTLERVIEMKFQMKLWEEKMEKLETLVKESISNLNEKVKQNENLETKISDTREQLENTINNTIDANIHEMKTILKEGTDEVTKVITENEQLEVRLQDVIVAQTSALNASLVEQSQAIQELKSAVKTPVVLFKARDVKDRSPSVGDAIIYKTIVQNEGVGYDPDTGIFTAPEAGTYLFTVQFCLYAGKDMAFKIEANGLAITAAYFYEKTFSYVCASSDGIAALEQGDDVNVVVTFIASGTVIHYDSGTMHWSYFSGVLLRT